jgi:hypothetical protein
MARTREVTYLIQRVFRDPGCRVPSLTMISIPVDRCPWTNNDAIVCELSPGACDPTDTPSRWQAPHVEHIFTDGIEDIPARA